MPESNEPATPQNPRQQELKSSLKTAEFSQAREMTASLFGTRPNGMEEEE